jgi:hypothetical protein
MSNFNDKNELLLRQVHPHFIQEGRVSSVAFRPTPKDQKKLSVNRGSLTTPERSFDLHTREKGLQSSGVWGVSVEEVCAMQDLSIEEDPISAPIPDPSHGLIDFSQIESESRIQKLASKLAEKARARGCLFSPLEGKVD